MALTLINTSCKKSATSSSVSRGTGWKIDNYKTFKEQETAPGLVFVEGGTFTKGKVQDDIMKDWNNTPSQQHVQSFYMDETEVTNGMYLEYLNYLKKVSLLIYINSIGENIKLFISTQVSKSYLWILLMVEYMIES